VHVYYSSIRPNFDPDVVHKMQSMFYVFPGSTLNLTTVMTDYAISRNLTPFISMQNHYNLVYREEEREMFPTLKVGDCVCGQMD
jgi:hypothetical protein